MARRLIVAALDIEVAQNGFTYYWCDDGDPSFEEVDKGGVGAELLEDLLWKSTLEVPGSTHLSWWEDHGAPPVLDRCVVGWLPPVRDLISWSKSGASCDVVSVGVDDGEMSVLYLQGYPHGSAMLNDV